jgi:hypothetical protein
MSQIGPATIIAAMFLSACVGASEGTRPDDMSAAAHEAAAVKWQSALRPTAEDLAQQRRAHALAVKHRVAARALVEAEASACGAIAPADRDLSPFLRVQDIRGVAPIYVDAGSPDSPAKKLLGATITFRPVEGLIAGWLQRIVDCHLARNASLGYPTEEMPSCPLVVKGATAVVKQRAGALTVDVTVASDPAAAQMIWNRAQQLGPRLPEQKKAPAPANPYAS